MRYISGAILMVMLGGLLSFSLTACSAPFFQISFIQKTNSSASRDPQTYNSEIQGSEESDSSDITPSIEVDPTSLESIAKDIKRNTDLNTDLNVSIK